MSVAQAIIPIFALILLGYGLRLWFRLRDDFWPQLDRLIYYVFFPALLFHSLSGFQIDLGAATPMLEAAVILRWRRLCSTGSPHVPPVASPVRPIRCLRCIP